MALTSTVTKRRVLKHILGFGWGVIVPMTTREEGPLKGVQW